MPLFSLAGLRKLARTLAPPGSGRRTALRLALYRLRGARQLPPFADPLSRAELNALLARVGRVPLRPYQGRVEAGNARRRLVEWLLSNPEVARAFPAALDGDPGGDFARWLGGERAAGLGVDPSAASHFREALRGRPASRPQHLFDCDPALRHVYPLGLTPAQLPSLALFMLRDQARVGLTEDEVLAFYLRWAVDPAFGLAATYLRTGEWQQRVPAGLSPSGWGGLLEWLRRRYSLDAPWLGKARRPEVEPEEAGPGRLGANVLGYFRCPCGLQVAALNVVAALRRVGVVASPRNVCTNYKTDLPGLEGFLGLHPHPVTVSLQAPEPVMDLNYEAAGLARRDDTYRIGYWYWELEQVPPGWKRHANWLHELWAPTRFVGAALRASIPLPVTDMLAGMTPPPVVRLPRGNFGLPEGRFLFLFAFDMCSSFERKNPLAVVEAFRRAFSPRDRVALAVKVSRGWEDPANLARLQDACRTAGAHLIDATLPHEELYGLMNACDAYVSLHRAEGYGLTMAEAMALGKPVIATAYSGNLDFMNEHNSLLADYTTVKLTKDILVYRKGCHWAEPSVDHAADLMRRLAADPAAARALGERGRYDVLRTLSLEAAGQRMAARLEELASARRVRAAG